MPGSFDSAACSRASGATATSMPSSESHLQLHIDDGLRRGLSAAEARRQAVLKIGGLERTREQHRDRRGLPALETLLRDLRYAVRVLRQRPGYSVAAIVVLALGIGANTAIFSVVHAVLLRPLPFPDADRLTFVWHTPPPDAFPGMTRFTVSPANFLDWQRQARSFERMGLMAVPAVQHHRRRRARVAEGRGRHGGVLPDARRPAAPRPHAPARRRRARAQPRRRPHRAVVDAPLRRRPRRRGPQDFAQRRAVHRGRRDAVLVPRSELGRVVDASGVVGGGCRAPQQSQLHRGGAAEARGRHGCCAGRDDRNLATARAGVPRRRQGLGRRAHPAPRGPRGRHQTRAAGAARRGGLRPADRVRQRREPRARADDGPQEGNRPAPGAGRERGTRAPPGALRDGRARPAGRRGRPARGAGGSAAHRRVSRQDAARRRGDSAGSAGARLHAGRHRCCAASCRASAPRGGSRGPT